MIFFLMKKGCDEKEKKRGRNVDVDDVALLSLACC